MINPERLHIVNKNATMNEEGRKLLWSLRNYKIACYFCLNLFNIENELYSLTEDRREEHLFKKISALICDETFKDTVDIYKKKKIEDYLVLKKLKEYSEVFMKIHNNIRKDKYMIVINLSKT